VLKRLIGLKKSYDLFYKSKQSPHPGEMLATQWANEWLHDKSFPLLYVEKGCGRYQQQKYVDWTTNS